jgi:hypothetical protein
LIGLVRDEGKVFEAADARIGPDAFPGDPTHPGAAARDCFNRSRSVEG